MSENYLKKYIGIFIIISNVFVVAVVFVFYFLGGFLYDEMTTTIALILPTFSVYTTAIVKFFLSKKTTVHDTSSTVSAQYIFIAWLFPGLFTLYLISIIVLKVFNIGFASFEQFKGLLMASETIFGAYVGILLNQMFYMPRGPSNGAQ